MCDDPESLTLDFLLVCFVVDWLLVTACVAGAIFSKHIAIVWDLLTLKGVDRIKWRCPKWLNFPYLFFFPDSFTLPCTCLALYTNCTIILWLFLLFDSSLLHDRTTFGCRFIWRTCWKYTLARNVSNLGNEACISIASPIIACYSQGVITLWVSS